MYWSFTVLVYANVGSVKMKIPCALVVSLTVDRLSIVFFFFIVFPSGYLCRCKETTKITFSSFLAIQEKTYSWKKIK